MKRKLTMTVGIIRGPQVLFLDEPTTGVDVASARQESVDRAHSRLDAPVPNGRAG